MQGGDQESELKEEVKKLTMLSSNYGQTADRQAFGVIREERNKKNTFTKKQIHI